MLVSRSWPTNTVGQGIDRVRGGGARQGGMFTACRGSSRPTRQGPDIQCRGTSSPDFLQRCPSQNTKFSSGYQGARRSRPLELSHGNSLNCSNCWFSKVKGYHATKALRSAETRKQLPAQQEPELGSSPETPPPFSNTPGHKINCADMDQPPPEARASSDAPSPLPARKRSSSSAAGLFSRLPFMRSTGEHRPRSRRNTLESEQPVPTFPPTPSFTTIPAEVPSRRVIAAAAAVPPPPPHIMQHQTSHEPQQQKTRRRRGSLRKVALLGRGAQRERREARGLSIDTKFDPNGTNTPPIGIREAGAGVATSSTVPVDGRRAIPILKKDSSALSSFGLGISDLTPRPSMEGYAIRSGAPTSNPETTPTATLPPPTISTTTKSRNTTVNSSPTISYTTTDDEDALHMRSNGSASRLSVPPLSFSSSATSLLRPGSSGSESYFLNSQPRPLGPTPGSTPSLHRRRSTTQRAKSPLALVATTPLPPPDADWDYAETEWWGWIILAVTWTVFVVGMGSCLGVWSWAWDVGTTPYAPPELEDDPTLPIVGYYPALIILTGVMAWVWVLVAWVGMKYFRHAQVSGD